MNQLTAGRKSPHAGAAHLLPWQTLVKKAERASDPCRGSCRMKTLFIDCDAHLTAPWASVYREDDPAIDVNTKPFERDAVPEMAAGYQIIIDDHSYFPAAIL